MAYTLHKPRRQRGEFLPEVVFNIDQQWVADLIEVQTISKHNKGYRYILVVNDASSKYTRAWPIKKKTGKDVTDMFAKIIKEAKGRKPQTLQTDASKEFYDQTFQTLMKTQEIHQFSTHGDEKASIVERFNRTLKSKLYRYFTAANTLKYVDILPKLVNQYNRTYHRSIKTTPAKVTTSNAKEVWNNLYGKYQTKKKKKPAFKVGDKVRLNKKFRPFKKGYLPGWKEEVFQVCKVVPGMVTTYKVHVPNEQGGGGFMRWQTPSPYAPPPFIGSWDDPQIGAEVKDMAKDFMKGVIGGLKSSVKKHSLLEVPRSIKRGAPQALNSELKRKVAKRLSNIFGE